MQLIGLKLDSQTAPFHFSDPQQGSSETGQWQVTADNLHIASANEQQVTIQDNVAVMLSGSLSLNGKSVTPDELLRAYQAQGVECLQQAGGHFVVVVVDGNKQQCFAATDKIGTHNLYYRQHNGQLLLSNKLGWLKQHASDGLSLCSQSLYHYVYFHCIPSPNTIYQHVFKLEPGRLLTINAKETTNTPYWLPEFAPKGTQPDLAAARQGVLDGLSQATEAYADNDKVGAFLSGGLDSSSVTAMLAKNSSKPIKTFTIGFSEPGYDEKEFAKAVAEKYNTNHTEYDVTPQDIFEYLPKIAAYYDEPFGNSSALPTFFCAKVAHDHGIETMLAGDGGDELFAGNERYAQQKKFEPYVQAPSPIRALMNASVPLAAKLPVGLFRKANSYIYQANLGLPDRLQYYNFLHQNAPESVFESDFLNQVDTQLPLKQLQQRYRELNNVEPVDNMLYLDWKFTLADNDLMKVNYMTEFAGVDVKYPMLDDSLLSLSCKLPADVKLPGQKLRDFYKSAVASVLPDSTINKSKQGFGLPFGKWLEKDANLKELARSSLDSLKKRDIIQPAFIDYALKMHQNVHAHYYGELVWIMIMLELWLQSHE